MAVELGRDNGEISRMRMVLEEYGIHISYDAEYDPEAPMGTFFCDDDPKDSDLGAYILKNLTHVGSTVLGPYEDYIGRDQREQKSYTEEDDDDDDDEEFEDILDGNRYRKMTKEEHEDYNKQINENLGFHIVVPEDLVGCGILKPLQFIEGGRDLDDLKNGSKLAVKTYNEIHKTTFVFDKVLKANVESCCYVYYITFVAVDGGDRRETFQATVYVEDPASGLSVGFCRIKPQS